MIPLRPRRGTPTGTGRVEAFSDGVFAVVITLLALDLGRLHADPAVGDGTLWAAVRHGWPTLLAYAAAFAFVGVAWTNHHNVLVRVASVSRALNGANLLLLAAVAAVPWATSTLAEALSEGGPEAGRQEVVLYGVVTGVGALTWGLLFHVLARDPGSLVHTAHAPNFAADRFGAVIGLAANAVAVLVAYLWSATAATVLYAALPVLFAFASEGFERVPTRDGTSGPGGKNRVRDAARSA